MEEEECTGGAGPTCTTVLELVCTSVQVSTYGVRQFLADFEKLSGNVKFSQVKGNGRKFSHIELSNSVFS